MTQLEVAIPTYRRSHALALTLASLLAQSFQDFEVLVSDQSEGDDLHACEELAAVQRVLSLHGIQVTFLRNVPRRGMAQQRDFLLRHCVAPYILFLDDDLILEPYVLDLMLGVIKAQRCGFVGCAPIGLRYIDDVRPHEQRLELWDETVRPERVEPGSREWERYRLHNAANLYHVQKIANATPRQPVLYKVAWVGACALYDREKLEKSGGFRFWRNLPVEHCGEDVLAQHNVMELFGGCGVLPSGVYHQELKTTIGDRTCNAPLLL